MVLDTSSSRTAPIGRFPQPYAPCTVPDQTTPYLTARMGAGRDLIGISSGLSYDRWLSPLNRLSRRSEDLTDLVPGDAGRSCRRDRVDYFALTTGPDRDSTSQ